jgi:Flp pilus assembly protein TadG
VARSGFSVRGRRGERGATLVEFAVVAPILFLMLFGVIEFARLVVGFTGVWTAAREGARYAIGVEDERYVDCAGILAAAQAKVPAVTIDNGAVTVEYFLPNSADPTIPDFDCVTDVPVAADIVSGTRVQVAVESEFQAVVPLLSSFLDGIALDSFQSRTIYIGRLDPTSTTTTTTVP